MLRRIKEDWADVSQSNNRMSAYTLQRQLRKRMLAREAGTHDGSVDLLITGCEVSLWLTLTLTLTLTHTLTLTLALTLTLTLTLTLSLTLTQAWPTG